MDKDYKWEPVFWWPAERSHKYACFWMIQDWIFAKIGIIVCLYGMDWSIDLLNWFYQAYVEIWKGVFTYFHRVWRIGARYLLVHMSERTVDPSVILSQRFHRHNTNILFGSFQCRAHAGPYTLLEPHWNFPFKNIIGDVARANELSHFFMNKTMDTMFF